MASGVPPLSDNVLDLASQVRRKPELARQLVVADLVRSLTLRWRVQVDMLSVSDEVPVTAWIVRRKAEGLVAPEVAASDPEIFDPALRPAWMAEAIDKLSARYLAAHHFHHPPARQVPRPRVPVKDPSLWKLAWSWPRLKPKVEPPRQVVKLETQPLSTRIREVESRLEGHTEGLAFGVLCGSKAPDQVVGTFLAVVHLWHRRSVNLVQPGVYGSIWVSSSGGVGADV